MSILDRMNLPQKLTIMSVVFLFIAAIPATFYTNSIFSQLDTTEHEVAGTGPIIALQKVIQFSQQHRGVSAGMLSGNDALAARLPETQNELKKAIEGVDAKIKASQLSPKISSSWLAQKQRLLEIQQAVSARQLKAADSTAQHFQIIADLMSISDEMLDESGLSFDSVANTYYLINATMVNAPRLAENMGQMRALGTNSLAAGNLLPDARARAANIYGNVNLLFSDLMRNIGKATNADAQMKTALELKANEVKAQIDKVMLMTNQQLINAQELKFPADEFFAEYTRAIDGLYVFNAIAGENLVSALTARVADLKQTLYFMIGMMCVVLSIAALFSITIVRSITGPMQEAIAVAEAVASGDLTSRIEVKSTNETGHLMQALKTMNENLVELVGKVRMGTDSITTASSEIAAGNSDLSQRTEEQASSLEETASSMEELASTVKQNADNARQANQLAAGASEVAVKGGNVVGQVVQTMSSINESSKKIVDIISVIDGIAFQTNILALNAAVEAARAGEQGRGFAVVATEVRTLAQRSAAAAKEIKELINDSVSKVEDGTRLVDEAGATMDEIVSAVKRVTDIMSEISAASQEQSSGIEQVNQAVTQMDEVTQQNAALVEEASAAAESMQEQAQALTQAVTVFKLSGGHAAAPIPVKRSNRAAVAKLPNRGSATKKAPVSASSESTEMSAQPRKVAAAGGGEDWEEF
jgi:methyl-accepting chemotaxis protein